MSNRGLSFASLLAVIGMSIVFGMIVGGRLNTPRTALAAPVPSTLNLAPAVTGGGAMLDFADVVEQASPSVVRVTSSRSVGSDDSGEDSQGQQPHDDLFRWFFGRPDNDNRQRTEPNEPRIGEGSGFVIAADGYLLTNNHVVEDADRVDVVLHDGREFEATVVGTDPRIDLALLKIDVDNGEQLPSLSLGDSDAMRVGEWVIAIGNPLEFEHTVTVGVLSAKERRVQIGNTDQGVVSFLQTDAAINLGNSGGPLLDARGNVIGINTAIRRTNFAEGIGFALPINHARGVIEQLRERGYVQRGWIGITMNNFGIDSAVREYYGLPDTHGVLIERVADGGPAEEAGLRRFDVIREVDGTPVRDNQDLISQIASHQPGDTVKVKVLRDGQSRSFKVVLGDRESGLRASVGSGARQPEPEEPVDEPSSGLGCTVQSLNSGLRERLGLSATARGVLVINVEYGSDAADRGLAPGMVISGINETEIRNLGDWDDALDALEPGDVVKISGTDPRAQPFSFYLRVPGE